MAWVEIKVKGERKTLRIPETAYKDWFKNNEAISVVTESKPEPILVQNEIQEEVKEENELQKHKIDEVKPRRKSTKKIEQQLS